MNRIRILAIVIIILFFGESAAIIFFANKSQGLARKNTELSGKLESFRPGYEKLDKESQEIKSKYAAVEKELEATKSDRQNVLAQVKSLMGDRTKVSELQQLLDNSTADMQLAGKEIEDLKNKNLGLKEENKKFQESQAKLIKERDEFKVAYEKARKDTVVKELKGKISDLEKDKNNLDRNLKKGQKDLGLLNQQLSKLTAEKEQLTEQLKDYKKNYADAGRKNKVLEQEIRSMPEKFTEIARQNKVLLRQTAEMHYNLGVFYTKNKEYGRAIAEFEKGVEMNPNDAYAHFNLGYIYAEYLVNRKKAIEHFRHYLRLAKSDDKDADWVKKYLLTWETYDGKKPM